MNIIPAKNNVHFGIMFIFKNSEQNAVFPMFIVLPDILLFCSLILSYRLPTESVSKLHFHRF